MADADALTREWNEFSVTYPSVYNHLVEIGDVARNQDRISTFLVDQVGENTRQIAALDRALHNDKMNISKLNKEQLSKAQKQKTLTVLKKKMIELNNRDVPEVLKNPYIMKNIQNFAKAGKRRSKTARKRSKTANKRSKTANKRSKTARRRSKTANVGRYINYFKN